MTTTSTVVNSNYVLNYQHSDEATSDEDPERALSSSSSNSPPHDMKYTTFNSNINALAIAAAAAAAAASVSSSTTTFNQSSPDVSAASSSSSPSSHQRKQNGANTFESIDKLKTRKLNHSAIERRRRDRINEKINALKHLVPTCSESLHKVWKKQKTKKNGKRVFLVYFIFIFIYI